MFARACRPRERLLMGLGGANIFPGTSGCERRAIGENKINKTGWVRVLDVLQVATTSPGHAIERRK